jgi:ribose-phosphate pyrophosphokinase
MIDTAGTITLAANALKESGALEVYACCTHAVLSGPAIERIDNSAIKELVITNSIALPEKKNSSKIVKLSVGKLIGEAIVRIHEHKSVSVLFE